MTKPHKCASCCNEPDSQTYFLQKTYRVLNVVLVDGLHSNLRMETAQTSSPLAVKFLAIDGRFNAERLSETTPE